MFTSLKRIFKFGGQNFFREKEAIFPTIFVLLITIFLISTIFLLREVGGFLITLLKERANIAVYFKEDVKEEEILKVKDYLLRLPEVKGIEYISKEEALEKFIQRYGQNPSYMEALEMVGQNPFLAALNIKAFEASQYEIVQKVLEKNDLKELIDHLSYPQSKTVIERIFSFASLIEKIGFSLAIIFLLISILVTFNTIRLAILNSKTEIEIQRMVGASNWFIQSPFLVQGMICGTIAFIISFLSFAAFCWFLGPRLENFLAGLNIFGIFLKNFWILFFLQFFTGILLAIFSSLFAIRRYLKI